MSDRESRKHRGNDDLPSPLRDLYDHSSDEAVAPTALWIRTRDALRARGLVRPAIRSRPSRPTWLAAAALAGLTFLGGYATGQRGAVNTPAPGATAAREAIDQSLVERLQGHGTSFVLALDSLALRLDTESGVDDAAREVVSALTAAQTMPAARLLGDDGKEGRRLVWF